MGFSEEGNKILSDFKEYADSDRSIYKHINLALYYSYTGDSELAIENLKLFSEQENYHYWTLIFVPIDPLVDNIKDLPEFKKLFGKIETRFWSSQKQLRRSLDGKNLI